MPKVQKGKKKNPAFPIQKDLLAHIHKTAVGTRNTNLRNVILEMSKSRNFSMKSSKKVIKVYKVEKG